MASQGESAHARLVAVLASDWKVSDPSTYCYLHGCYLGDGHVIHRPPQRVDAADRVRPTLPSNHRRSTRCDDDYVSERPATSFPSSTGASDVVGICHPGVGRAFPQHGPGRKHLRRIAPVDWQREFTHPHPQALIRGLIHSDGCRVVNRFRTKLPSGRVAEYSYVRYFFSNHSKDIRDIFVEH